MRIPRYDNASATTHLVVSLSAGLVAAVLVALVGGWRTGLLAAWIVGGSVFLLWTWSTIWGFDGEQTSVMARHEDPTRFARDVAFILMALGTVLVVAVVIFHGHASGTLRVVLGIACIAVSWLVLQTILTLRYAALYYGEPHGGFDFKQDEEPTYRDFAYVSFTVGMTFQIADTDVQQSRIRTTVLGHALVSFVFSVVIIGVTVNLVAGLSG